MPNDIIGRWLWQVGGLEPAIRRHLRHMSGITVKHRSHLHHCSGRPDSFAKAGGAIGWGENRLRHIAADLALVDSTGRYNLYIGRTVAQIGNEPRRERGCQYRKISGGDGA